MHHNHHNEPKINSTAQLLNQLKIILEHNEQNSRQVANALPAEQLSKLLDLTLSHQPAKEHELIDALQTYLEFTPKTDSAKFNKLLFSGRNNHALLADWVTSYSNTTMHTYQVAPVASLMEIEIIQSLCQLIGFEDGDGTMVSGGSMANMIALLLARHKKRPDIKQVGFYGKPLVAYVSELCHYSFEKAITMLGLGSQNLVKIKTDAQGIIIAKDLKQAIQSSLEEDKQPFFVGLTAGTTVIGSYDNIKSCAEIATQHDLWLHMDGAWGGPVLMSDEHRDLLKDSKLADSFTWDAHKLLNVPLTAAALLVKDKQVLEVACGGGGGKYLFHHDENSEYNLGVKSLACGRRVDSLKFWLSWKAQGLQGYANKIDYLMQLKNKMVAAIEKQPDLTLLAPANFLNVLFRVEPKGLVKEEELAKLNIAICKQLHQQDLYFVDYAYYKGQLGIRFILANEQITEQDIQQFLEACLSAHQS